MAAPIQIQSASTGSSSSSSGLVWTYNINTPILYSLGASVNSFHLISTPTDYPSLPEWNGYTDFRVEAVINQPGFEWLEFTATGNNEIFKNNILPVFNVELDIINTGIVTPGSYQANIEFTVFAKNPSGINEQIEVVNKFLVFQVSQNPDLDLDNENINLTVLKNSTGSNPIPFQINCNSNWNITQTPSVFTFASTSGSGNNSNTIAFAGSHTHSALGYHIYQATVTSGSISKTITVKVLVVDAAPSLNPNPLNIFSSTGQVPALSYLNVLASGNNVITGPSWLNLPPVSTGSGPLYFTPNVLPAGNYTGVVSMNISGTTITTPVNYTVANFVNLSNLSGGINYTRDNKKIIISQLGSNSFARLTLDFTYFDWQGVLYTKTVIIERSYYQNSLNFDLGEFSEAFFIRDILPKLNLIQGANVSVLSTPSATKVKVKVEEVNRDNLSVTNVFQTGEYSFILGRNKDLNLPFFIHPMAGYIVVNKLMTSNENYSLIINGKTIYSGITNVSQLNEIYSFVFPINTTDGNDIEISIGSFSQSIVGYTPSKDSFPVFFNTEHNLLDCFTFNGVAQIEDNFNYQTKEYRKDFINFSESDFWQENNIITLESGPLDKYSRKRLKQLLTNRAVYIMVGSKTITLNPLVNKITTAFLDQLIETKIKFNISIEDYDSIY